MATKTKYQARQEGSMLVGSAILVVVLTAFVAAVLNASKTGMQAARTQTYEVQARYIAESGMQLAMFDLRSAAELSSVSAPFGLIDGMDTDVDTGAGNFTQIRTASDIMTGEVNGGGQAIVAGQVDVAIDVTNRASTSLRDVVVTAVGYVPSKAEYDADSTNAARVTVKAVLRMERSPGEVFDYSYFINHWGWFYGNTIVANGNVRANGQFDFGGYGATVNGNPRYESANGANLEGYQDDNNDGVMDGSDGGAYAGWEVINAANVRGMGAAAENQHSWQEPISMPNLSDLSVYESVAANESGSISVAGTVVVDEVIGDDAGEAQNLFLVGTAANPIVLNGPVVVRGDVIIMGVVTGQGTIYSGRNVYVPGNVTYANGPTTDRPAANDQATVEAWRSANTGADALGLFAREHVVVGDYTDATWQSYVSGWVGNYKNESSEDAGADGIQNTRNGPDGILGTADDDLLEGDGVWTVEYYTAADASAGLIPAGASVGDPIPGTGEDLDGDGTYDGTNQMSEFNTNSSIADSSQWEGNMPGGISSFSDFATTSISNIDGNFYTNHAFAALMLNFGGDITMNGSIISRNESIIYGANHIYMNHDARLLGRDATGSFGLYLPQTWAPITIQEWTIGESSEGIEAYVP